MSKGYFEEFCDGLKTETGCDLVAMVMVVKRPKRDELLIVESIPQCVDDPTDASLKIAVKETIQAWLSNYEKEECLKS